jgi:hypothetical protein
MLGPLPLAKKRKKEGKKKLAVLTVRLEWALKKWAEELSLDVGEVETKRSFGFPLVSQLAAFLEEGADVFWNQGLENGVEEGAVCSWSASPFVWHVLEEVREHLSTWPNQDDSELRPCRDLDGVVHVALLQQELLS